MICSAFNWFWRAKVGPAARTLGHRMGLAPPAPEPPIPPAVLEALALRAFSTQPKISSALADYANVVPSPLSSREIFTLNGHTLPCWLESDLDLEDDWLTTPRCYPIYHALFAHFTKPVMRHRLLEIGVRTGYVGAVFARAAQGAAFYLGVDPNLYVANGLDLAGDTFRRLREVKQDFESVLIEGYSGDANIQNSLNHTGPFDLIHIDGDHSLRGKLIDLHLCRRLITPGGLVLVDDWDHLPTIPDAINRALTLGWYKEFALVSTKRGLAIL